FLFPQHPKRIADRFEKTFLLRGIDVLHFSEEIKWHAELLADIDERGDVLWKTRPAIADAGVEKITPNAPVHSDTVGDFFDVGAARFADRRDSVDVGDLQSEKRIRGMFDELGAVNVGHENGRHERLINFLH